MQSRRTFALWLFLFCLISPLSVAQVYKVTDLGPLAPTAINNWGQVVGNLNGQALLWTQWGNLDLGTLAGGTFSNAAAINDFGAVAGTANGLGTVISHEPGVPNQENTAISLSPLFGDGSTACKAWVLSPSTLAGKISTGVMLSSMPRVSMVSVR